MLAREKQGKDSKGMLLKAGKKLVFSIVLVLLADVLRYHRK